MLQRRGLYEKWKNATETINNKKINQLAKEFDGQLEYLGENKEKYITFLLSMSKELDNGKIITYKLKFFDSFSFVSTSPSKLVDNLS